MTDTLAKVPETGPAIDPKYLDTLAMRLAEACRRNGATIAFGHSNPTAFHLCAPAAGLRNITYRQENSGGVAADGYARIARRVPVVTAQNGPAATLLVAPMAEALRSSIPMVAIVQDVPASTRDRNAFQELDHLKLFSGCTKWLKRCDDPNRIEYYVDMAFRAATSGRGGPAVLLVGADLFDAKVAPAHRHGSYGSFPLDRLQPSAEHIAIAAQLLASAKRPVVIAGGGCHLSDASAALTRLQDECHLPVATTQMGKGIVAETNALSIGVIGYLLAPGNRANDAVELVQNADVVLLVGTRTTQNGTNGWTQYAKDARYIHIDVDPEEIGHNYESMRLAGDARLTLDVLADAMSRLDLTERKESRRTREVLIAKSVEAAETLTARVRASDEQPIRPERVMAELDPLLTQETIVVADASHSCIWISMYLKARWPGVRFVQPRGIAGLGWGLPLAIGAKLASPESTVIAVVGDGGFAHTWAELETIKRHGIKLVILVMNNQILASQQQIEHFKYGANTDVGFEAVDHAAIARACGLNGVRIERPAELAGAIRAAIQADVSTVLDIIVDPDARPPMANYAKLTSQF
jgi:acetolactate synthase-1/2/3 large subunit